MSLPSGREGFRGFLSDLLPYQKSMIVVPLLEGSRRLAARVEDPDETIRLSWLEGRLLARLGDFARARAHLETARLKYVAERQLAEAALVTLELAAVPARRGKGSGAGALIDEVQESFQGVQGIEEILQTLRRLCDAKPHPASQPQSAEVLRKLILDQGHRFEPLPFA